MPKGMSRFVSPSVPRRVGSSCRSTSSRAAASLLRDGGDAVLVAYGPVMLNEALTAAELLEAEGLGLAVLAMPWLNRVDAVWLEQAVRGHEQLFVLEDHSPVGGLADALRRELPGEREIVAFGVEGWPACGTPTEALRHHGLDGRSVATRIAARIGAPASR